MSTKEIILLKLDRIPDLELPKVLNYLQLLEQSFGMETSTADDMPTFWDAYLESEQEYNEVYQRLADA